MDRGEARAVARLLLEDVGGVTLTAVCACQADDALPAPVKARISGMADRVVAGEPVQYVVGAASFCGMRLRVGPGVLIPRPETEQLVDDIVRADLPLLASSPGPLRLLDIGTGSGCIALALKRACPEAEVEGWDISPRALAVARDNAAELRLDVTFRQRDILSEGAPSILSSQSISSSPSISPIFPIHSILPREEGESEKSTKTGKSEKTSETTESEKSSETTKTSETTEAIDAGGGAGASFSLLVSNPPYVCEREAAGMEARVLRHEPREALFVPDADPLRFYRAIARAGQRLLRRGGLLRLEINRDFGAEMCQLLSEERYASVEIKKDLYGNDRYAYATWNP